MNFLHPHHHNEGNEFDELLLCASEIERKFGIGRARDIRPGLVQEIIDLSVVVREKTNNNDLAAHLSNMEYTAYAILDNEKTPDYYKYLDLLSKQLKKLKHFK